MQWKYLRNISLCSYGFQRRLFVWTPWMQVPLLIVTVFTMWCWELNLCFRSDAFCSLPWWTEICLPACTQVRVVSNVVCEVIVLMLSAVMPTQSCVQSPLLFRDSLVLCIAGTASHRKGAIAMVLTLWPQEVWKRTLYWYAFGPEHVNSCEILRCSWTKGNKYVVVLVSLCSLKHLLRS